jgi:hypothetical protein
VSLSELFAEVEGYGSFGPRSTSANISESVVSSALASLSAATMESVPLRGLGSPGHGLSPLPGARFAGGYPPLRLLGTVRRHPRVGAANGQR